jgi:uncharacterized protein YhdP
MQHLTPARLRWRRARRTMFGVLGVGIIILATLIGAAGIAFPWVLAHPEKVRDFLSERLKRPVRFAKLHGDWTWSGPVFTLENVEVGDAPSGRAFAIDSAELAIDFYAWARADSTFSEFRVVGIEVDATRGSDGVWRIARLGKGSLGEGGDGRARELLELASISLRSARVHLTDELRGMDLELSRVDIDLVNEGTHRVGAVAWIAADSAPIRIACQGNDITALQCYAGGQDIDVARWLAGVPLFGVDVVRGTADLDVWFGLRDRLTDVHVEMSADSLVLRGSETIALSDELEVEPRARVPLRQLSLRWKRDETGWRADWLGWNEGADPTTRARVDWHPETGYAIVADRLDLGPNAKLLSLSNTLPPTLRRFLFESSIRGNLSRVDLKIDTAKHLSGSARLDGVAWRPGQKSPGFETLSGDLLAGDGAYVLTPDADTPLTVDFPHVFRQPLQFVLKRGTFGAYRDEDGWHTELVDFALGSEALTAYGRTALVFDGDGRPFLDMDMIVERVAVPLAKRFWPINAMAPRTVEWLDRGLLSGEAHGVALVHGDLDDWPFKTQTGRFEAIAELVDTDVLYHPKWPIAHLKRAQAEFVGNGMAINIDSATMLGVTVSDAHADIPNFHEAELTLHAEANATGPAMLELLRKSPIQDKIGPWLAGLSIGGTGDISFDLLQVLHGENQNARTHGSVLLHDADLSERRWNVEFGNANGRVRFDGSGVAADDLAVTTEGEPAILSLASGDFVADAKHSFEAGLRGELSVATVMHGIAGMTPLVARMPGRSDWNIELSIDRDPVVDAATAAARAAATSIDPATAAVAAAIARESPDADRTGAQRIVMRSDLAGTAIDLPAPLRKDAASALPVRVDLTLPFAGSAVNVKLGELMQLRARIPGDDLGFAAGLTLGTGEPPNVPASGISVRGAVTALDVGGWLGLAGGGIGSAGGPTLDLDLHATDLTLYSRRFADTHVEMASNDKELRIGIAGPALAGTVVMPRGDGRGDVTAEFERLHLPDGDGETAQASFDPSKIPSLHVWAKDLRFGKAQLGEARIETFPIAGGLRFDRLETNSPDIEIRAKGDWTTIGGKDVSNFDVTFTAQSLGRMLDALGFAGIVEGGQTIARIEGTWVGSPAQFGLAKINGVLEANVGKGRILDVNPGAGRLLGLISLQAIPRRLALDFSDFFKSGMSFDSIVGRFQLREGDAFTSDLQVKGPAADIKVTGRTGIATRDYDQQLEVTPRVGGVLPVVGALAAGPVGAAAGLVFQGVLKSPLNQMVRARYRVTGSWEDPDITLVSKERVRAVRRPPPAIDAPADRVPDADAPSSDAPG